MRRIDINKNTCETFDSIDDLINTVNARPYAWSEGYHRKNYRRSWAGYSSYDAAVKSLRQGKIEDVKALNVKTTTNATGTRPHMSRAVVGSLPCVPASIIGLPKSMYRRQAARVNNPVVVLNIDCAQNCFATRDDMREYGRKCVALIKALEAQGKRVRAYACECINEDGARAVLRLMVKDERAPLDIKRLTFPLCDSAMLRIIAFDWYEHTKLSKHTDSYGYAINIHTDHDSIDFINSCDRQAIYINHQTDFDSLQF